MNQQFKELYEQGRVEPVFFENEPFVVGGLQFYQFGAGGTQMSASRFYAMADMNRDHEELKLDAGTLDTAISVIDEVFDTLMATDDKETRKAAAMTGKLHIANLKQRRKFDLSIERTFDNATAWYFSDDENPLIYDKGKATRNKMLWMEHPKALSFFLSTPMTTYVGWQTLFDSEGLNSLKKQLTMELSILENTLQNTERLELTNATSSILQQRKEMLDKSITSALSHLNRISASLGHGLPKEKPNSNAQKKYNKRKKR